MKKSVLFAALVFLFIASACNLTSLPGISTSIPPSSIPPTEAAPTPPSPTEVPPTVVPPTTMPNTAVPPTAVPPILPAPPIPPTTVPSAGITYFVLTAVADNISNNWVYIDNPLTNNNPNAIVFATSNWNPGGVGGTYNNHEIGVWYDATVKKWAVYNQDRVAMPVGASFNVAIIPASTSVFVQTASAANISSDGTFIDNPLTNNHLNVNLIVTANYNPAGSSGTYNNHPIGVWYDSSTNKWAIYNQDRTAMPVGAAFNVLISSSSAVVYIQTVADTNVSGNWTSLDDIHTKNNPNAVILITSNWNPTGGGGTYLNHSTGVWYNSGISKWAVYNQDLADMPLTAAFNIVVLGSYR